MCGIVGYIGPRNAAQVILDGLRRLEYRGYDSAGIAVIRRRQHRHPPRRWQTQQPGQQAGRIAHRKATSASATRVGPPTASPASVTPIRTPTSPAGWWWCRTASSRTSASCAPSWRPRASSFKSDTDTEVIAHLVGLHYTGERPLAEAVRLALSQLRGPSAIVVMSHREPGMLVAARLGNAGGVSVGFGDGEMFIASDMPAILEHTRRMVFLENGQMAVVTRDGADFSRSTAGR